MFFLPYALRLCLCLRQMARKRKAALKGVEKIKEKSKMENTYRIYGSLLLCGERDLKLLAKM